MLEEKNPKEGRDYVPNTAHLQSLHFNIHINILLFGEDGEEEQG